SGSGLKELLKELNKAIASGDTETVRRILEELLELLKEAFEKGDYDLAISIASMAVKAASYIGDTETLKELLEILKKIKEKLKKEGDEAALKAVERNIKVVEKVA
uniref:5HCS_TGFBR2_1 n=1 Tax=synthetic construct TaxID=32630 RepID=UPI003510D2D2